MKKLLAVMLASACILGMAAPAMADVKVPVVAKTTEIQLVKKDDGADFWYADCATTLIAIRNLKWDAKILDCEISGVKQVKVEKKAYGAYHLNLCVNKYAAPGKTGTITFVVKQNGNYYKLSTKIKFVQGKTPFASFLVAGESDVDGSVIVYDCTKAFAGYKEATLKYSKSVDLAVISVEMAAGQSLKNIYGCFKNGCERKLTNGNQYKLSTLDSICVEYETTIAAAPKYFKKESGSFTGTKRFPVKKCVTLFVKAK